MLHGPCGKGDVCTVEGKCSKKYPKPFYSETNLDEDGYLVYRQRDSKVQEVKGKFTYDNKYVVPYNRYLLLKYQAHINVEWCNRSKAIKPLKLWVQTWELLSEDILCRKRKLFKKTFLYETIISRLRSKRMIVLAVASSGYKNPEKRNAIFGGVTVLQGGDFRQILPVIPKGKRAEIVQACINRLELWKSCKIFTLTKSMRVNEYCVNGEIDNQKKQFNKWVLDVGDGIVDAKKKEDEDEATCIEIPADFIIKAA
nr:ATP-dependent DNA helicase PIF1-like [Tanacetum cinerariifolium]